MKCPVCITAELNMTDRQGVEIDYCPNCRGVWLDRGELDKIIERSSVQGSQPTQTSHPKQVAWGQQQSQHGSERKSYHDDHHDKHHGDSNEFHGSNSHGQYRKKSWLADIFD